MNRQYLKSSGITLIAGLLLSGCYTQIQTVEKERITKAPKTPVSEKVDTSELAREAYIEQEAEIADEESYIAGYEDGFTDAEIYYYKDYETERFYDDHHASLGHRTSRITYTDSYYGSPFHHHSGHFTGFHHPGAFHHFPHSGSHFGLGFGHGHHLHPGFFFGFSTFFSPHHHSGFFHGSGFAGTANGTKRFRNPRTGGLRSRGTGRDRRVRSNARRSARTGLADRRVNIRNRGTSNVRSRSGVRSQRSIRSRRAQRSGIRSRGNVRSYGRSFFRSGRAKSVNRRGFLNRSSRSSFSRGARSIRSSSCCGIFGRSSSGSRGRSARRSGMRRSR